MSHKLDQRFKDTVFAVEANSFEAFVLWKGCQYEQQNLGSGVTIGHIGNRPVVISFTWATLNKNLIVFYTPTSELVDYVMLNEWLDKHCTTERCDAANFHQCLNFVYKGEGSKQKHDRFQAHIRTINDVLGYMRDMLPVVKQ